MQGSSLRGAFVGQPALDGRYTLYAINHGGRESVEVFTVDARGAEPTLQWNGCALLPAGLAANSVASYSDGTLLVTVLNRPGTTITDYVQGRVTGGVFQLTPGSKEFVLLPGTELPGNNGIETAPDDSEFYVVAFGLHAVVAFDRNDTRKPRGMAVAPDFMPDNLHWDDGRLVIAGMRLDEPVCGGLRRLVNFKADDMRCHRGYVVAALDPRALQYSLIAYAEPDANFNGTSAAVVLNGEVWLGSFRSDRIAIRTLPGSVAPTTR